MSRRYILSEPAAHDLDLIKSYLIEHAGVAVARHVLREIRSAVQFLAANPGVGHLRDDLTDQSVKFWPVFSYLVIYNPTTGHSRFCVSCTRRAMYRRSSRIPMSIASRPRLPL